MGRKIKSNPSIWKGHDSFKELKNEKRKTKKEIENIQAKTKLNYLLSYC